ncbi:MAG: hypothetical protein HY043_03530 [Verrucomicrobia bacterium]|nr:hypothetical protein [Verrucomicrobiota bacterium]
MALAISLAFHLALFTSLELGRRYTWWQKNPIVRWLREAIMQPAVARIPETKKLPPPVPVTREIPLTFVDVDPEQATLEPPKDAKFYSSLSTKAANPDPKINANVPKIDGQQTKIIKSFDTLQPQKAAAPPKPPPPEKQPDQPFIEARAKPAGGPTAGDLFMAKPQAKPALDDGKDGHDVTEAQAVPRPRPRTLAEARIQKGIIQAPKMKQEGGVQRLGAPTLDVKGKSFGAYDAAIVEAVQQRWYDLLKDYRYANDGAGKVVLEFHLNQDGRITEMKTASSDVDEILSLFCQRAVLDPNPYAAWPLEMKREIGASFREVRFTFYY